MLLLMAALLAQPEQAMPLGGDDEIVVTANAKPYRLSGTKLRAAIAAFNRNHARYAPQSGLTFLVRVPRTLRDDAVRLSLHGEHGLSVPVVIDARRHFVLPPLPAGRFELVGTPGLRVEADVRSPGTADADRRLGDVRLECRADVELMDIAFPLRGLFDMAGGCGSSRFGIYASSRAALDEAKVVEGSRSQPLPITPKRHSYRLPLGDTSFGDESRIRLSYAK